MLRTYHGHSGIDCHGGTYIFFKDNYIYECLIGIISQASDRVDYATAVLDNIYIERNIIENDGNALSRSHYFIAVWAENVLLRATHCYIRDNNCSYTTRPSSEKGAFGVVIYNVDSVIIERNKIYKGPTGDSGGGIGMSSSGLSKDVIIRDNWIDKWYPCIYTSGSQLDGDLTIYNNITVSHGYAIYSHTGTFASGVDFTIYNNSFFSISASLTEYVLSFAKNTIGSGASVKLKNNIIGYISPIVGESYYISSPPTITGTFECDYNLYWNASNSSPFLYNGQGRNWTYWTSVLGYDVNGLINTDPFFKNSSGSYSKDLDFDLQSSSPSINKGLGVGLTTDYAGNPISGLPDIGAFETQPAPDILTPTLIGSVIENATPSILELTYSIALANIVPAASAFVVNVNSSARTISSATISGTKVLLTLASPIAYGDIVTVAYTKPSTNPLQTSVGSKVVSFTAQTIINKVAPPTPAPAVSVYVSAAIENAAPTKLEITYNLALANIVPAASAFTVTVNSIARTISSVAVSGTKVTLTLSRAVAHGDIVTVAYSKPPTNPLQTSDGGQILNITAQSVSNRVNAINNAPVVVVSSPQSSYSGFVSEINASGSYDPDQDPLTFTWSSPGIALSSTSGATIKYLSPLVSEPTKVEFTLKVSDGKTLQSKTIPVDIQPYKPELEAAEVLNVEASEYYSNNYPYNVIDGNIGTIWSVNGIYQWLILELKELFTIQNVKIAFQYGQKKESYFDVLGSNDKEIWEPILNKSSSCNFSGDLQVFDFPPSKADKEFKYIKLIGLGNPTDSWNYISEVKIFGYSHKNPSFYNNLAVKIYPNPASSIINLRIDDPTLLIDFIKIINLIGEIVFQDNLDPEIKEFQFSLNLQNGLYIVQMGSNDLTMFTQKLIVTVK